MSKYAIICLFLAVNVLPSWNLLAQERHSDRLWSDNIIHSNNAFSEDVKAYTTLSSFTVSGQENGAYLMWETDRDINTGVYQVLRSYNGVDWEILTQIESLGRNDSSNEYQWVDRATYPNTSFYRIRQIDGNGHLVDFPIVHFNAEHLQPLGLQEDKTPRQDNLLDEN